MRLASIVHGGRTTVVAETESGLHDMTGLLLEPEGRVDHLIQIASLVAGLEPSTVEEQPLVTGEVTFAPLLARPGKIVAAPVNYTDHQEEMKHVGDISALGFFLKSPSSVAAHEGIVRLPYVDRRFDQEGELALVIKKRARHISPAEYSDYVAGYTCLLDITMRGGEDRSTRKSFDTFTPVGPFLVTPDEIPDLSALALRCSVNGTLRQDADIAELIWDVPAFVSYVSSVTTLEPGDIVTTGTPAGVGPISDGDVVEVSIDQIGTLRVTISSLDAMECPTRGANSGPHAPKELTPVRQRPDAVRARR
ncbi:5-carboxymethyl-2-hydroxymuconate isomerase [Mycolicibacterium litorale]|nr:5-carboxymethyl-2-hydroxymuconate isomerase [Mycolicibacterium litorale]